MYADDEIGFGLKEVADADQQTAEQLLHDAFGDDGVSEAKRLPPTTAGTVLGMNVDLVAEFVRPSDRAFRKMIYAFFSQHRNKNGA